jgi:hypothetical protein
LATLVIVGAGPRGIGILERVVASAAELLGDRRLVVHVVDPYPPGAGRVWRHEQSPLMRLNSMARDITVWTDETVTMDGPAAPGPTLDEWARTAVRDGVRGADGQVDAALTVEAHELTGTSFASRQLQRAYLTWFFEEVCRRAPDGVEIVVHADRVVGLDGGPPGAGGVDGDTPQTVHLASGAVIVADAVVMAVGHLDRDPTGPEADEAAFGARHHAIYVPPAYTADEDLSALRPGADVIVRGLGLAFIDLMVLLTEERGGRYGRDDTGRLVYHPSGSEPTLWAGSRRGVPYRAKLTYDLLGGKPDLPRYFSPRTVAELADRHDRLEWWPHVWPLVAKELAWGYYRELALGHPDRSRVSAAELDVRFSAAPWATPEMEQLLRGAFPCPADRLDLARLDRPLAGRSWASQAHLEAAVSAHIESDLTRRADPSYSADLGLFVATLTVTGTLARVLATGKLSTRSRVEDMDGWWWGFFSSYSSGPPPERLEQLVALQRAGILRYVGPDMWVERDESGGRWRAGSRRTGWTTVEAGALVDARLPRPSVSASQDPLIRALRDRGDIGEEVLADRDGGDGYRWRSGYLTVDRATMQLLDRLGRPHPRRFALGANTSSGRGGAFARPRTNAPAFRQNDGAARTILGLLAGVGEAAAFADR